MLFYTLARGGQFVLMGDAHYDDSINGHFRHLKDYLNDNPDCHLEIGYREELAHLIYAGADVLIVPSMFEPCGLAPLIAMRYGTVPVVRATGGMVDTVFDRDHSGHPPAERNGYVFHHTDNRAIESALSRALRLWSKRNTRDFRCLWRAGLFRFSCLLPVFGSVFVAPVVMCGHGSRPPVAAGAARVPRSAARMAGRCLLPYGSRACP